MKQSIEQRLKKSLAYRSYVLDAPDLLLSEEWREVPEWEGYWASNLGRIRDLTGGIIQPALDGGRPFVQLWHPEKTRNCSIATVILLTFVGPPPSSEKNLARHLDDDPHRNCLDNLAWGSKSDNAQDAIRNGRLRNQDPDRCAKISASKKGKWIGGIADNRGRVVIHNGIKERRLSPGSEIPSGWYFGRLPRVFITNGIDESCIHPSHQIPPGWYRGRSPRNIDAVRTGRWG